MSHIDYWVRKVLRIALLSSSAFVATRGELKSAGQAGKQWGVDRAIIGHQFRRGPWMFTAAQFPPRPRLGGRKTIRMIV